MTNAPRSDESLATARFIRRIVAQWRLIVGCALLAAIAGYLVSSSREKQYEATTTVQLTDVNLASVFTSQNLQQQGFDAATKAATNAKLVTMPRVRALASRMLGGTVSAGELNESVSVNAQPGTTLLDISATSANPVQAMKMSNAMRAAFIQTQQLTSRAQLDGARERIRRELNGLPKSQASSPQADDLKYRLSQLDNLVLGTGAGVSTVQTASLPTVPVAPRPKRDAMLALLVGGFIGLAAAFLRARLDDRVRDEDELAEFWELPVLGQIPRSRSLDQAGRDLPAGATLEAFALARTNLRYLHVEGESGGPIIVTSSVAGEGKSTVSWNLALAAAMAGTKVLLVDADLRRPVLGSRLGVTASRGFSEVLAGLAKPAEVIREVRVSAPAGSDITVDLMPAGFVPPSPIALLERETTAAILAGLSADYDLVLIDTPPATVVADAKVLLERAAGAIVVSRLGVVTSTAFERLRDLLSTSETPILGVIVNDATSPSGAGYDSYYAVKRPADGPTGPGSPSGTPTASRGPNGTAKPPAPSRTAGVGTVPPSVSARASVGTDR